jgi:dTDP-glucose 4,6-dehydratase
VKVVITGAAGFIGSNLSHYWRRLHPEDELVLVDALTYAGHRESIRDLESGTAVQFVRADLRDAPRVEEAVRGSDLIIHLAAETHNDRAVADPMPFVRTNVEGTAVLLEAARRLEIPRFHHVSTDEVFGSLPLDTSERFDERSPYQPRGPYSASKAAGDHLVRAWNATYGLPVTLSNCSNNFGPYQHPEKLIPLAITRLIAGEKVPLYGDGLNVRDWIHVDDHCTAIDAICHRGKLGTTYLVSAGWELPNVEVVRRILKCFGKGEESIEYVSDRPGHDRRYALDAHRLRTELGWRPERSFDEGLLSTVEWYRSNGSWWKAMVAAPGAAR